MIKTLKRTRLGLTIHRLSQRPFFGAPLKWIVGFIQIEQLNIQHFSPTHIQHNRTQARIISEFENRTRTCI